jgi:CheY-like chemotaxis protein
MMPEEKKYDVSVLIAEDDPNSQLVMKTIVKKHVREVFTAYDGVKGLQSYIENNPDIVISDIGMPGMNGLDMCEKNQGTKPGREINTRNGIRSI